MSPLLGALLRWRRDAAAAETAAEELSTTAESMGEFALQQFLIQWAIF